MNVFGFDENKNRVNILDLVYPIGSIYISTSGINPGGYLAEHGKRGEAEECRLVSMRRIPILIQQKRPGEIKRTCIAQEATH